MLKKWIGLLLAAALLAGGWSLPAAAAGQEDRVVRVAYPVQAGLTDFDEFGNYSGYTYEYLEEIAQYTGWDYEFVQVPGTMDDSLSALMGMLQEGEIDLMGAMLYTEQMGEMFDYASHNYGVVETVLQVPYDDVQEVVINSQVQQTIRVAVAEASQGGRMQRELEDYCAMNLITPVYVYRDTIEEQLEAVREGSADALLNTSLNYVEGSRAVARFAPKPFYFITTKGKNAEMMEELNSAIMSIEQTDPTFSNRLYEKYFTTTGEDLRLTDAEAAYIDGAGALRVGVLTEQPPLQYLDERTGELDGISADLLRLISDKTGLAFELVPVDSPEELYSLAEQGGIDLAAGIPYDYDLARERHLSMTRPYISSQYLLMMKEGSSEETIKGKRLALTTTSPYRGETVGQVVRYAKVADCIRAVESGEADYTYVDAYMAQYFINQPQFRDLKLIPQTYEPRRLCYGVVKPAPQELLSILNKAIMTLSTAEIQGVINQNTLQKQPFSFRAVLMANPVESVAAIVVVSLAVIAVLLLSLRRRVRASREAALELKKHFRVYALVNEYFFEYSYRNNTMFVSDPSKGGSEPDLLRYDYSVRPETEREAQRREAFLKVVRSREDGVHELYTECIDGMSHWLRIALETVYDGDEPAYALGRINVIDEERQEKDQLMERAQLDSLTHVFNSEACQTHVRASLSRMREGERGALLLIDIDYFKQINDTYGHMQGDEALGQIAGLLRSSFRADDIVGRPGGDEFLVYLPRIENREFLFNKCAALCSRARDLPLAEGGRITISVGAALSRAGDNYAALYQAADEALYDAKKAGRDQFAIAERKERA